MLDNFKCTRVVFIIGITLVGDNVLYKLILYNKKQLYIIKVSPALQSSQPAHFFPFFLEKEYNLAGIR